MENPTDVRLIIYRHFSDHEGNKNHDTELGESNQWRFTPSMLDNNSYAFASFANQPPDCFTPTLGVNMSAITHNQAGDLHTPGLGFGLGTPLSISNSEGRTNPASAIDMQGFHPHLLHSHTFQNANSFAQPQSFAPSSFMHQDSGYETMHGVPNRLPTGNMADIEEPSGCADCSATSFGNGLAQPSQSMEK